MIIPRMSGSKMFHTLQTINRGTSILLSSGYCHHNFSGICDLMQIGAAGTHAETLLPSKPPRP